jgi:LCP family protein required for cell wall assembly
MAKDPDRPEYRVYRSRPRLPGRSKDAGIDELRREAAGTAQDAPPRQPRRQPGQQQRPARRQPEYEVHGARRGGGLRLPRPGRVLKWLVLAAVGWVLVSVALFLVSAQIQRKNVSDNARGTLAGAGFPLTSPNTILVLGSDARTKGTKEPGAQTIGQPSRSDSILLLRAGGGKSARLSIPRDTVVDIPGHGRNKINAAYAFGGAGLTIQTIHQWLGIEINHVVEVNFENFPEFIDSLGGVNIRTGCVVSRINGGSRNGGYTLRLRPGNNHIDGKQALALARTRKNDCNKAEDDLTRARRQQKIMASIKSRLLSPTTFFRLPWVAWSAPKAIRSDMGGPTLLGLFGAVATGGNPPTRVLKPNGGERLPDGGAGLVVSEEEKRAEVARFLNG